MSAHAPGPYHLHGETFCNGERRIGIRNPEKLIAEVITKPGDKEGDATAALLKAAPVMLQTLSGLLNHAANQWNSEYGHPGNRWRPTTKSETTAAALIEELTGKPFEPTYPNFDMDDPKFNDGDVER